MKSAILVKSKSPLIMADIDLPKNLKFGQVLVKVCYSGICGAQINEIDAVKGTDKFLPHFHIPLQSGSNKILKAMRRRYDRDLYVDRINSIKSLNSDTCIGVDVMVGFPGESDEDFLETYNFLNDLDISYLHVFTYSERKNTYAIQINETIPKPVKAERSKTLHALSNKKRRLFYDQFISTKRDVLFENVRNGKLLGHTDNYIKVEVKKYQNRSNQIHSIKLTENRGDFVMGIF